MQVQFLFALWEGVYGQVGTAHRGDIVARGVVPAYGVNRTRRGADIFLPESIVVEGINEGGQRVSGRCAQSGIKAQGARGIYHGCADQRKIGQL